jgi:DNA-binding MarR family transcriptional regulator
MKSTGENAPLNGTRSNQMSKQKTAMPLKAKPAALKRGASLALDQFLPYRLATLSDDMSRALARVYSERFDVSIPEWRVIANLGRTPLGAGDLAKASSLDKPAVTRAIQRLELRGFVSRSTPDGDRRRAILALTQSGRALYAEISALALQWEARVLAQLPRADRDAFLSTLSTLQAALKRI